MVIEDSGGGRVELARDIPIGQVFTGRVGGVERPSVYLRTKGDIVDLGDELRQWSDVNSRVDWNPPLEVRNYVPRDAKVVLL